MKTYARIEGGRVAEIIEPLTYTEDPADWPMYKIGDEVPIELRFTPEIVATLVDISDVGNVGVGDTYEGGIFSPYVPPQSSAAEILAQNTATRDSLLATAASRLAPLQDAVDLEEATAAEIAALKLWKKYRVDVNRVDLTLQSAVWPTMPS